MELLEDKRFKSKYQKHKIRVKQWESSFMDKYGRKPTKSDIKEAGESIRSSYKEYYKMKTQVLDESLFELTMTGDDSSSFQESSQVTDPEVKVDETGSKTAKIELENIDPQHPTETPLQNEADTSVTDTTNVDGVWGDHLIQRKTPSSQRTKLLVGRSSSFQLSSKKFTSSSFLKRNPRKSLSSTRLRSKTDLTAISSQDLSMDATLDQTTEEITSKENDSLIDSCKVVVVSQKPATSQSVNVIQKLVSGQQTAITRKVNPGWLERCHGEKMPLNQRNSLASDSGFDSSLSSMKDSPPAVVNETKPQISDDEDFVCNSDSEEERRSKRIRNSRKWSNEDFSQPMKRHCSLSCIVNKTNEASPVVPVQEKKTAPAQVQTVVVAAIPEKKAPPKVREIDKSMDVYDFHSESEEPNQSKTSEDSFEASVKTRGKRGRKKAAPKKTATGRVTKRTSARGKKLEVESEENIEETRPEPENIYAIEQLEETTPRLSLPKFNTGDLVADCAIALSKSTDKTVVTRQASKVKRALTDKEKLEEKIANKTLNVNHTRVNLKKKVFVRGHKNFNFSKYKKNQWKQKKKSLGSTSDNLDTADFLEGKGGTGCFKCGETGHFSRRCPNMKADELLPEEDIDDEEPSEFPTLEEAETMAKKGAVAAHSRRIELLPKAASASYSKDEPVEDDYEEFLKEVDFTEDDFEVQKIPDAYKVPESIVAKLLQPTKNEIEPLYPVDSATPKEVFQTLSMFNHQKFRPGQEKAIMRILSGQSTLVTLSTGSGKSLCYQLPAYLYAKKMKCITLVISPLVSLMDDQVTGVPDFLSAACLHTNLTPKVRDTVMDKIRNGKLDILLVSPEAVVAGEKSTGFGAILRQLPPIAFACIDEVHCISQWSHNFRPSYLMVCKVLREKLKVKTILGLTATATKTAGDSIAKYLGVSDLEEGIISDVPMPKNLMLTVSKDADRDLALVSLLKSERFKDCNSIIVYCTRQVECQRIASLLRSKLGEDEYLNRKKEKISCTSEVYHAGLSASRRKLVQKAFMEGKTKIVVATVAFGMGINKADIRAVIHYNMPSSFEGYVQEVGRAGRDGKASHCHLFLSPRENRDKVELTRHIHANGIDSRTVRQLLDKVFIPCACESKRMKCPGHEVGFGVDETVCALDISEEMIATLLCYLELHEKRFITVLSSAYMRATVSSYGGPKSLKEAAQSSPPLAMAIAMNCKNGKSQENSNVIQFPVVDIAAAIGWDSGVVKSHLKNLEWTMVNGQSKRSKISVKFDTLGFRIRAPGDMSGEDLNLAKSVLLERAQAQETSQLYQLETIYETFNKFSSATVKECVQHENVNSENIKGVIRNYFQIEVSLESMRLKSEDKIENEAALMNDIRALIYTYKETNFNGRAIARIFHGIQSPNFPASNWGRCRFWRSHLSDNFNLIIKLANKEIEFHK